jgi:enediyne biosynthesis protein E4
MPLSMKQKISGVYGLFLVLAVLMVKTAKAQSGKYLFEQISNEQTGIDFVNMISDSLYKSSPDFLYLINGSGSGVADLNGDGKPDIFFSSNTGNHRLYLNEGNFKFKDVTEEAGIKGNGKWGTGVCIVDINGDGLLDIFVSHSGNYKDPMDYCNEAFICTGINSKGIPRYVDKAKELGLDLPGTRTTQVAFFDYDRDGDLDCFVLNHSNLSVGEKIINQFFTNDTSRYISRNMLLRNDFKNGKPHFTDVTKEAGIFSNLRNYGLGVVITDFNNDNWPDIYCTSDFANVDHLYLNNHDGTFTDCLPQSVTHTSRFSMGTDAADINNDLRPDVATVDMLAESNYYLKIQQNQDNSDYFDLMLRNGLGLQLPQNMLQLNMGNDKGGVPKFTEIAHMAGVAGTNWSWTVLFLDFNNDGWKDLFISCGYLKNFSNQDVQNKYITNKTRNMEYGPDKLNSCFFINDKKLGFTKIDNWKIDDPQMSYSACAADFDNDGRVDLLMNNLNKGITVLKNEIVTADNYINIKLKEGDRNPFAIGAKVFVTCNNATQVQEMQNVRGYESSQDYVLHFGLGNTNENVKIRTIWPDGTESETTAAPHATITINKEGKTKLVVVHEEVSKNRFSKLDHYCKDTLRHTENRYFDFKHYFTLPYNISTSGPGVAEGDINGDGITDYYMGGAVGKERYFILGQKDGTYTKYVPAGFPAELMYEDVAAALIDVDGDGDLDLVVISGGIENVRDPNFFTDRVYKNDGKGNFEKVENVFPKCTFSKSCLAVGDFDHDGKPDLFIGGYTIPDRFEQIPQSFIYKNQSDKNGIKFTDVTNSVLPGGANLGMVTSASWVDLNGDNYPELIVGGEWMSCKVFKNDKGILKPDPKSAGLNEYKGMYEVAYATDYNEDGKMDIIVGNTGSNLHFHASKEKPMKIFGVVDTANRIKSGFAFSYFNGDIEAFASSRNEILDEFVPYRKYFPDYETYATRDVKGFFQKVGMAMPEPVMTCNSLLSGVFINQPDGGYKFEAFPQMLQISRMGTVAQIDWNFDGKKDYVVSGNFLGYKHQLGSADEMPAFILENQGAGKYRIVTPDESGLYVSGQVKKIFVKQTADKCRLIFVRNNDNILMYENNK